MFYYVPPRIVEVAPAPHPVEVVAPKLVTPESDLIAQTRTFRVTHTETFVVEYIAADQAVAYEQLLWFLSKDGDPLRILPVDRVWNVVVYDKGEKWASK